eukprot:TRINITY_DN14264_c0_g1_i3.p1 TRINITY_DN14264_c0_g1~~TRINITY_DN14264_c0_g1_i3.p1  ORF type:complete len:367 (+),score=106.15 TRINITY_DN14264_c0_g1_i3:42-1142(+)
MVRFNRWLMVLVVVAPLVLFLGQLSENATMRSMNEMLLKDLARKGDASRALNVTHHIIQATKAGSLYHDMSPLTFKSTQGHDLHHPPLACPGDDHAVYISSTANPFYLCTHGLDDAVSSSFIRLGYWLDCPSLEGVLKTIRTSLGLQELEIVEVGGNIGTCTWVMASSGARVTAFEPVGKNFQLLQHSSMLNTPKYGRRVLPINKGCGSKHYNATVKSEKGNMGNSVSVMNMTEEQLNVLLDGRETGWEEHRIEITTLDSEISRHVNFMKMDCQGHEIEALLGAQHLLSTHGVDVIKAEFFSHFLKSSGHEPRELLDLLDRHGYVVLFNGAVVPPETFGEFQHGKTSDIFAVKKGLISPDLYPTLQ